MAKDKRLRSLLPVFDPYRIPESEGMKAIVADVEQQLDTYERMKGTRKRKPKARDQARRTQNLRAVIADVSYRSREGRQGIRISRDTHGKESRYTRGAAGGKTLPAIIDALASPELAFIEQEKGFRSQFGNQMTVLRPGMRLLSRLEERGVTIYDINRANAGQELVVLKGTKVGRGPAEYHEYEDTDDAFIPQFRAEITLINAALAAADIEYVQDLSEDGFVVDERNRFLRRVFTRSCFSSGGRLFGGFWQPIGRRERLANTLIGGEPVVALDFKAMGVMLAYHRARAAPPEGDLYPTIGHLSRDTVKRLMGACMFALQPLEQWPRGLASAARGVPVGAATAALREAHPALTPFFFTGVGHALQFTESEILVDILLQLIEQGIVGLPTHDAVVVPESAAEVAEATMRRVFEWHTDLLPQVTTERAD